MEVDGIKEIFSKERMAYFDFLEETISQVRSESSGTVAGELLLEMSTDQIPYPYRLYRPDLLYKKEDGSFKIIEANKDSFFSFPPISFTVHPNIQATLSPFIWHGIEFRLVGNICNWTALEGWMEQWIDMEDEKASDDIDFNGVIHSVTEPERENDHWLVSIDMGSADVDCLLSFFGLLPTLGVESFEMGSFSLIEN